MVRLFVQRAGHRLTRLPGTSAVQLHVPGPQRLQVAYSYSTDNGNGTTRQAAMTEQQQVLNVLGSPLECCCRQPMTGFYRDGFCRTDESDHGRHVVCARVTQEFLEFSRSKGNDLMTPAPWANFPGLKDGDKWCLCASRWSEALDAGVAPPLYLKATHTKALQYVTMEQLLAHALDADTSNN